jgi:hypothetical protein
VSLSEIVFQNFYLSLRKTFHTEHGLVPTVEVILSRRVIAVLRVRFVRLYPISFSLGSDNGPAFPTMEYTPRDE